MSCIAKCCLISLVAIFFSVLSVFSAFSAEILQGKVIKVIDGDTVTIVDDRGFRHRIRFSGIDAPEKNQPYGEESTKNLKLLVHNKRVLIEYSKYDRYDRIIGVVLVNQQSDLSCQEKDCVRKINVGLELIKNGLAWHYKKYQFEQREKEREDYSDAEINAREKKLGLWADKESMPPWKWRKRRNR